MDGGAWWAAVHGVAKSWTQLTSLSLSTFMHWRRKWQPTPVFLPGKYHGWRSLVGYSPWGRKELDKLSNFTFTFILGILAFHINFRINLLLSIKYLAEILTVIVLIDQFGENWYLGNLDFPYPWPQNSSPFVNFLEFSTINVLRIYGACLVASDFLRSYGL